MFLYVGCRRVWVHKIIRCVSSLDNQVCGYILECKESPCCTVPFDVNVNEEDTIQICDEHGFRCGEKHTGKAMYLVIENLKTELMIDETLG